MSISCSHMHLIEDTTPNLGKCPNQEWNWSPLVHRTMFNHLSHTDQGRNLFFTHCPKLGVSYSNANIIDTQTLKNLDKQTFSNISQFIIHTPYSPVPAV